MAALNVLFPTLNDTAAATANVSRIQALLDAGGACELVGSGVVYTNDTLVIGSDTQLSIDPRTRLTQADSTNKSMLVNAAYQASFVAVTVGWTAGLTATVAWTGHGKEVGDYVWVRGVAGTAQSQYFGVFRISAVADADNFTIKLRRRPTAAPSGAFEAKAADTNISVSGAFDYNEAQNAAGTGSDKHAVVFGGIARLRYDLDVVNADKYCASTGALADAKGALRSAGTGSDGIKVYGPAFDVTIDGVFGNFTDDAVSVQPQEAAAFSAYDFTGGGDCINVTVKNVDAVSSGAALAVLYSSQNQWADDIKFENIAGKSASPPVRLVIGSGYSNCQVGSVSVANVEWQDNRNGNIVYVAGSQTFERIDISGIFAHPTVAMPSFTSDIIFIGSGSSGDMLRVSNVRGFLSSTGYLCNLSSAGFSQVLLEDMNIVGSASGNVLIIGGTATVRRTVVRGSRFASVGQIVEIASGAANTPHVIVENCDINAGAVVNPKAASKISIRDNRLVTMGNGVVRADGAVAISVFSQGNTLESGSWLTQNASPVVSIFGDDFRADVTTLARTDGSFCFNTNAAAGTLAAAGRVTCQGTAANSWRLLGDPTLQY